MPSEGQSGGDGPSRRPLRTPRPNELSSAAAQPWGAGQRLGSKADTAASSSVAPNQRINVVWFKCTDLRVHDHAALSAAHADGLPVLHLYVFDPFWYEDGTRLCKFPKTGVLRTRFQRESVADLSERLEAGGHSLSTRTASTEEVFEELSKDFKINAVFAFHEICSEEKRIERRVKNILRKNGQGALRLFWGFELYHHDDLSFDPERPRGAFNSYTAFRKRVEENCRVRPPLPAPKFSSSPELRVRWARSAKHLPTVAQVMGKMYSSADDAAGVKDPRAEFLWSGGETAALARVKEYLWDTDSLGLDYVGATMTTDPSKSCMRDKAMSKLSPWLAHGCLSPRLLYEEVKRYERERRKTKSTYWITHELLWRDFVRFGSIAAGTSIFKIGGLTNSHPNWRWSTSRDVLSAWKDGVTGFPFIDCFMRELKTTGYCNHMGRETAGWFLIGDLGLDWRMGAEWFESVLLDYEPTANWYNWAYRCLAAAARPGPPGQLLMDDPGHRLRGLEILKWGTQHDPDAEYIKRWIPALKSLPGTTAREPWRLGLRDAGVEANGGKLRPVPQSGSIDVSRGNLEKLTAMGFTQQQAAVALWKTWEDVDAAVTLIAEGEEALMSAGGDEDEELARALAMSLEQPGGRSESSSNSFRYGVDYPKPIIQPVSIHDTEKEEDEARRAQANRDRQNDGARQRGGRGGGGGWDKAAWESYKGGKSSNKGGGKESNKGGGRDSYKGGGKRGWSGDGGSGSGKGDRKRRWGANSQSEPDDRLRGA